MATTPTIRMAVESDWRQLSQLRLRALNHDPAAFGSTYEREITFTESDWRQRAASTPTSATFVATVPGRATAEPGETFVGMAGAFTPPGSIRSVDLVGMWLDPDFRGTRVASALVLSVLTWAVGHDCDRVNLWVARPNLTAKRLYERVGFVETGEIDVLPSDPCISEIRMRFDIGRMTGAGLS